MPNAKRPAGPTKPMHLEREKAIEREQMDEALGLGAAAADADSEDEVAPRAQAAGRAAATRSTDSRPR